MTAAEILPSVISGIAVLILAGIARGLWGLRRDFHRFMAEHLWLLATTLWTRDKVIKIMEALGMPAEGPPPNDLPKQRS